MTESIVALRLRVLNELATEIREKLERTGHKPWKVAGVTSYGWPKIKIVFETDEEVLRLRASPEAAELGTLVAAAVRNDPILGEYGPAFRAEEALFIVQFPQ
jgi:hypothetical protein